MSTVTTCVKRYRNASFSTRAANAASSGPAVDAMAVNAVVAPGPLNASASFTAKFSLPRSDIAVSAAAFIPSLSEERCGRNFSTVWVCEISIC